MKRTLVLLCVASTVSAQVPLRGLAYDSLHGRPLAGAFVGIVGMNVSAMSDSTGHFVLAGIPKGTYRVVMQHDVLDAIGLSAAGARAVVSGERDSVVVAVPSLATLWRAACGRDAPSSADSGFVFGSVRRGGSPVPSATVAASWLDLSKDSTGAVRQKQKVMEVDADSAGNFSLCDVPTTTGLSLRANVGGSYGVWTDIPPLDRERIGRRDLTIVSVAPMRFDVPSTTTFTGRLREDASNTPIAGAEVILADLGLRATSDERGEFRIPGVAPGTHKVQVRKIGYGFAEQTVEFDAGAPTDRTLVLSRVTTLDSVSVTASSYSPNDEAMRLFEEHRKLGLGKFFTRADLEKSRDRRMVELLGQLPGIKPEGGSGGQGWLLSSRSNRSLSPSGGKCTPPMKEDHPESMARRPSMGAQPTPPTCTDYCYPRVYVDGVDISPNEIPNINRFSPDQIEAIEYYSGAAQVPPEYNRLNKAYCGVVLLHMRRGKSPNP
jgi:hypothetical protein